jgi:hypothetical protein
MLRNRKSPISVGTPVDDVARIASTTPPISPSIATAADVAANAEIQTAAAVTDGGADAARGVVRSVANRTSTAVNGLRPKSAGGVLGLGLALAAGGAGVIYMHKNRGRPKYVGAN